MFANRIASSLLATLVLAGAAGAQDSVSLQTGLPGDAVGYADPAEQVNTYVVDLTSLQSSWGTPFGVAPLLKSSQTDPGFYNSLWGAQAASADLLTLVPFPAPQYMLWGGQGFGVNGNPLLNTPGSFLNVSTFADSTQFAAAAAEFGGSANNVVAALANYRPGRPSRLYVARITAAVNGANLTENRAAVAAGSVDAGGAVHFRADNFLATGPNPIQGNNVFRVRALSRTPGSLNIIDDAGGSDAAATDWLVVRSGITHNTPSQVPASLVGRPLYSGSEFTNNYLHEAAPGVVSATTAHLGASPGHRGNVSFSPATVFGGATVGTAAMYGQDASGTLTNTILLWGVLNDGSVNGTLPLVPPSQVTDNSNGFLWPPTPFVVDQFILHRSQTAFRGGNGPVAVGSDAAGDALVSTLLVSSEFGSSPSNPINAIGVARFDPTNPGATLQWTVAAYNDFPNGKQVLDGPGGTPVGQCVELNQVTGGTPLGPSFSAPMIDAAGNVWFFSALEIYGATGSEFVVGLVRAVYDAASFSYELELVLRVGQVLQGRNSDTDYLISFLRVADNDSIDSGSLWSGNLVRSAWNDLNPASLLARDPRTLGGMVVPAEIVYDVNRDGLFEGGTTTPDQQYQVLLYLGHAGPTLSADNLVAGQTATVAVRGATPGGPVGVAYSLAGPGPTAASSGPCGTVLVDLSPPVQVLPILTANLAGTAVLQQTVPPGASGATVYVHALDVASCTLTNSLAEVIG